MTPPRIAIIAAGGTAVLQRDLLAMAANEFLHIPPRVELLMPTKSLQGNDAHNSQVLTGRSSSVTSWCQNEVLYQCVRHDTRHLGLIEGREDLIWIQLRTYPAILQRMPKRSPRPSRVRRNLHNDRLNEG